MHLQCIDPTSGPEKGTHEEKWKGMQFCGCTHASAKTVHPRTRGGYGEAGRGSKSLERQVVHLFSGNKTRTPQKKKRLKPSLHWESEIRCNFLLRQCYGNSDNKAQLKSSIPLPARRKLFLEYRVVYSAHIL